MARILANMLDGGSEETLFFGGAGQFVLRMADVSACAGSLGCRPCHARYCWNVATQPLCMSGARHAPVP